MPTFATPTPPPQLQKVPPKISKEPAYQPPILKSLAGINQSRIFKVLPMTSDELGFNLVESDHGAS